VFGGPATQVYRAPALTKRASGTNP